MVDDIVSYAAYRNIRNMGLPGLKVLPTLPPISEGLAPDKHGVALALLKEYAGLLSKGLYAFGLLEGTQHQLKLKTPSPSVLNPIGSLK